MDTQTSNNSRMEHQEENWILMQEHRRLLIERTPLIVFMSIVTFLGICGNILTVIFYTRNIKKQTPTVIMIKYLAIFDLIVCFLAITTVTDLAVNILFKYASLCKTMYFLDHWFVVTSVFILCAISIDRYRKMCKPHGRQFTNRSALWTVIILSTVSMAVSTHDYVTYDIVNINITSGNGSAIGHYCTNTDEENKRLVVVIFHALDACTIMASFLTFIVMYGTIWYTLRKHNKAKFSSSGHSSSEIPLKSTATHSSGISLDTTSVMSNNQTNTSREALDQSNENIHKTVTFSLEESNENIISFPLQDAASGSMANVFKTTTKAQKGSRTNKSERQLTIMMFAITVAFCVCFIPYFIVIVYVRLMSRETEKELSVWVEFALRSPFWNSVVNPFIFCVFNSQYRQYVKNIFTRCCRLFRNQH